MGTGRGRSRFEKMVGWWWYCCYQRCSLIQYSLFVASYMGMVCGGFWKKGDSSLMKPFTFFDVLDCVIKSCSSDDII